MAKLILKQFSSAEETNEVGPDSPCFQNTLITMSLLALLMSSPAMANPLDDSDAVGGSATNTNVAVTTTNWTVLNKYEIVSGTWKTCIATGSADAAHPTKLVLGQPQLVLGKSTYYFTVSDSPNPPIDQGQERTLEFLSVAVGTGNVFDNTIKAITTTGGWMANSQFNGGRGFFSLPGNGTIYLLARKALAATPNLTVTDSSLTITCTDKSLQTPADIPG